MRTYLIVLISLLLILLSSPAEAQTYIKGPGLIEGTVTTATAAGTTTLTKDSQTNQTFSGVANQTVVLPNATTLPIGRRFYITNRSTGIVTANTNGGAGLTTIAPDTQKTFIVKTVGTAAGTWDVTNWNVSSMSGILPIANGGTNKALTLSAGGIPYFDADSFEVLSAGSSGQILRSGGAGAPSWSTATFPATAGTSGTLLQSNGTNWVNTTATFPGTATGTGTLLRADGTNWAATTVTFPNTTTINQILYSSANNVVSGLTTGNTSALVTSSTGVPSLTLGTTANRLLRTDGTTVSFAQAALTTDVTGVLPMANGGTNKNMTASAGAVVYSDADSQELTAVGNSGEVLRSNGTSAPAFATISSLTTAPTVQRFTSGSGTYTTPAGVKYIIVTVIGGGGGGQASNTSGWGNAGNTGNNSTFGTSLLTANGGAGGNITGGLGGVFTVNAPAVNIGSMNGGAGGAGTVKSTSNNGPTGFGGGSPYLGGGGSSTIGNVAGLNAITNSGGGGGGAGLADGTAGQVGAGGGAGGGIKALITSPSATYSYAVGASVNGGTAGTNAGGNSAAGVITVEEYYQ